MINRCTGCTVAGSDGVFSLTPSLLETLGVSIGIPIMEPAWELSAKTHSVPLVELMFAAPTTMVELQASLRRTWRHTGSLSEGVAGFQPHA
eukprot:3612077-Rhodomonas_salina.1